MRSHVPFTPRLLRNLSSGSSKSCLYLMCFSLFMKLLFPVHESFTQAAF